MPGSLKEAYEEECLYAQDEVRVTDPDTGGQKGQKPERYDLIPAEPMRQLALVYGMGAEKYSDDNWRKGYRWRLSLGAMFRHIWSWVRGESHDKESGLHHLAHAAWHCFTLIEYETKGIGTDDVAERQTTQARRTPDYPLNLPR